MIFKTLLIIALIGMAMPNPAAAAVKFVSSAPEWEWVARQIGGKNIDTSSLLSGREDPHFLDATPSFIRKVADANIVCSVGLDLEVAWLPRVLERSGNADIQKGGQGFCELGKQIEPLGKPSGPIDRSMGDVHSAGNPHFQLSIPQFIRASRGIRDRLVEVDPENSETYKARFAKVKKELEDLDKEIAERVRVHLKKNPSFKVIEYHKEFTYFLKRYGIPNAGAVEETPGVPPSAGRLARVAIQAKKEGVALALGADYSPRKVLKKFSDISGVPYRQVPISVQPNFGIKTYPQLMRKVADAVLGTHGK